MILRQCFLLAFHGGSPFYSHEIGCLASPLLSLFVQFSFLEIYLVDLRRAPVTDCVVLDCAVGADDMIGVADRLETCTARAQPIVALLKHIRLLFS